MIHKVGSLLALIPVADKISSASLLPLPLLVVRWKEKVSSAATSIVPRPLKFHTLQINIISHNNNIMIWMTIYWTWCCSCQGYKERTYTMDLESILLALKLSVIEPNNFLISANL